MIMCVLVYSNIDYINSKPEENAKERLRDPHCPFGILQHIEKLGVLIHVRRYMYKGILL